MNTENWKKWRHSGIGGSDAAAIMGVSPWKTELQLYEEKIQPEPPGEKGNFVTDRGQRLEPKIRAMVNLIEDADFEPALFQSGKHEFMKVSLDGQCGDVILEIKTASREDHAGAKDGKVPEKYFPQVQHALAVSGAKYCVYASYWDEAWDESKVVPENLAIIRVEPDPEYISRLICKEEEFWDKVCKRTPPKEGDRDWVKLDGLVMVSSRWRAIKKQIAELEDELEKVEIELSAAAGENKRAIAGSVRIQRVDKKGSIDYGKVPELGGVDLEQYRKPGSSYFKFTAVSGPDDMGE